MISACSASQQPEVYAELLVLRLDYIMMMCVLYFTKEKLANADRHYLGYKEDFARLVKDLLPPKPAGLAETAIEPVAEETSSGVRTAFKPAPPAESDPSPCPGVSKEL